MILLFLKQQYENKLSEFIIDLIFTIIGMIGFIFVFYDYNSIELNAFIFKVVSLSIVTNMIYYSIFDSLNFYTSLQNIDIITSKYNVIIFKLIKLSCAFSFYLLQYILLLIFYNFIFDIEINFSNLLILILLIFLGTFNLSIIIEIVIERITVNFNILNIILDIYNFTSQTYFSLVGVSKFLVVLGLFNMSFYINGYIDNNIQLVVVFIVFLIVLIILCQIYKREYKND